MPNVKPTPIPVLTARDIARFWSKIDKTRGPDACWLWTGARHLKGLPYGKFSVSRSLGYPLRECYLLAAHRVAYFLTKGVDPGELLVCHDCPAGDNALCCNPAHHWLGTSEQNTADRDKKGRTARGDRSGARLHPEKWHTGEEHHVRRNPALIQPALDMLKLHPELHARGDKHWSAISPEKIVRGERNGMTILTAESVLQIRRRLSDGASQKEILADLALDGIVTTKSAISHAGSRRTWKHM